MRLSWAISGFMVMLASSSWGQTEIPAFPGGLVVQPAPANRGAGPMIVTQMHFDSMEGDTALTSALKRSSLTYEGKPFHALLSIGDAGQANSGSVEVWWVSPTKYRVALTATSFKRVETVNGNRMDRQQQGDFLPLGLEEFEDALLNPVPMESNFRNLKQSVALSDHFPGCISRDDRVNGITDETTRGSVCVFKSEPLLLHVETFNYGMNFSNFQGFGKKQIAREYHVPLGNHKFLAGFLTLLEPLKNENDPMFTLSAGAVELPRSGPVDTVFVSTLKEESMVAEAPKIEWPPVREGRTEGYMIIYARTDVTGQVREAHPYNSDNAGVLDYGAQQVLRYKFKPLLVDGRPVQMEMPLVLHFVTKIDDPIPILTPGEMKAQMIVCEPKLPPKGTVVSGSKDVYRVSVDENGKFAGEGPAPGRGSVGNGWYEAESSLQACTFKPYVQNGKATYYKGDIEMVAP
jgi:hypothetical protein